MGESMASISSSPTAQFPELNSELEEVRVDAENLINTLSSMNHVPSEFPTDDLLDIAHSLSQLREGSIASARVALEYGRDRLPQIRKSYFNSLDFDDQETHEQPSSFLRRGRVDESLKDLITSTVTALDACRAILNISDVEPIDTEEEFEVSPGVSSDAKASSLKLEQALDTAKSDEVFAQVNADLLDQLSIKLADAANMNRLARAETARSKIALEWLLKPLKLLQSYPKAIRKIGEMLEESGALGEVVAEVWLRFQRGSLEVVLNQLKDAGRDFQKVAKEIEALRKSRGQNLSRQNENYQPQTLAEFDAWLHRQIEIAGNADGTVQYHTLTRAISSSFEIGANELASQLTSGTIKSFQSLIGSRSAFVLSKRSHMGLVVSQFSEATVEAADRSKRLLIDRAFEILGSVKPRAIESLQLQSQLASEMPLDFELSGFQQMFVLRSSLKNDSRIKYRTARAAMYFSAKM
jgi:hypothetical protein